MSWTDSHCHLDMIEADVATTMEAAVDAGVDRVLTIGTTIDASKEAVGIAESDNRVFAVVGVHPHDASTFTDDSYEQLAKLARGDRVVGIGETGLDFYRDLSPRDSQKEAFRRQIDLAKELGVTLVIHMRDAHDETFEILKAEGPPSRLVFHCFSGGVPETEVALELGGYLSFAGNVTFASADELRSAAAATPLERMLVETDAPFLAPVPHRGKPNEPALVPHTGRMLAEIKGVTDDEMADATTANAAEVFGLG